MSSVEDLPLAPHVHYSLLVLLLYFFLLSTLIVSCKGQAATHLSSPPRYHTTHCCAVLAETLVGANKHHKMYSVAALKWITEQVTNGT
jgi:hypothetical protein